MSVRSRLAISAAGLILGGGTVSVLGAQQTRQPDKDTPFMLVLSFQGNEPGLGMRAADAVRTRLRQDFPFRQLWIVEKAPICASLEQSGYKCDEVLEVSNAQLLARAMRADDFMLGSAVKNGANFQVNARLILSRDAKLSQPLPTASGPRLDAVATAVSREYKAARAQLDGERKCANALSAGKLPEAVTAARAGIAAYANGTLARLCLARAFSAMKAPDDSIIRITREVLAIDSLNRQALELISTSFQNTGNKAEAATSLIRLLQTNPTDTDLAQRVVNSLAASGEINRARDLITKIVADNPGNTDLQKLQFLILLASNDWKRAIAIGESLAQDTMFTDQNYFERMAAAYSSDSQPQKAAAIVARGTARFPQVASLWALRGQLERRSGQLQQGLTSSRRAAQLDPKSPNVWLQIAQSFVELNQPDSALATLKQGVVHADSAARVLSAQYALSLGNAQYRKANTSKVREDFMRALPFLGFADSVSTSPASAFLVGVTHFNIGISAAQDAPKAKNCDLARLAQSSFNTASIYTPKGGSTNPAAAGQIMSAIQQYGPTVEKQVKSYCKS